MKDFVYDRLPLSEDCIRLLQILPQSHDEEIRCHIDQYPASACPSYCAVSYTWGKADETQTIILNDRRFRVRQNLWWLLFHLRQAKEIRKLWIDAVCIEQASVMERNHQVRLMGTIYKRAEMVLVWLGRASEDSRLALDLLMDFPNITEPTAIIRPPVRRDFSTGQTPETWLKEDPVLHASSHNKHYKKWDDYNDTKSWAAFANLCRRDYWYRTWIVQELLLASDVYLLCGDTKVSWKALEHIANVIPRGPVDTGALLEIIDTLPFRFVEQRLRQQPASLSVLLHTYQDSQCVDPRDKVYAMLALASDCRPEVSSPTIQRIRARCIWM